MFVLLCGYPPFFGDSDQEVLSKAREHGGLRLIYAWFGLSAGGLWLVYVDLGGSGQSRDLGSGTSLP